jgi:hypothetical protein
MEAAFSPMEKLRRTVAEKGLAGSLGYLWDRYLGAKIERRLKPNAIRSYPLQSAVNVCIPALDEHDREYVVAQLEQLQKQDRTKQKLNVRVASLLNPEPPEWAGVKGSAMMLTTNDPLELLGHVASSSFVLQNGRPRGEVQDQINRLIEKLHIREYADAEELLRALPEAAGVELKGPVRSTQPIYEQMKLRVGSGHYGYAEDLRWDIVEELPRKFEILSQTAKVDVAPLSSLFIGKGRVARQLGVGKKYGASYFQGESVLDVGCDICGIKRSVGPNTRYVGADMQGLADVYVNLDEDGLPFEPRSFETVLCFEALEHFKDIHGQYDRMLDIADRYFIGSLFIESATNGGRSITKHGHPIGNAHLPFAPIFDRHWWIFTFTDALDFVYYRARKAGFRIKELNLFFPDNFTLSEARTEKQILRAFRRGDIATLARKVSLLAWVAERE